MSFDPSKVCARNPTIDLVETPRGPARAPVVGTWSEAGIPNWLMCMRWVVEQEPACDDTEWKRLARKSKDTNSEKFIDQLNEFESDWLKLKAKIGASAGGEKIDVGSDLAERLVMEELAACDREEAERRANMEKCPHCGRALLG